ncbi:MULTISPECIES: hypothetical protein [unclassified Rhizobium]|uniref:hypothetical protein n=1 Tax=unclassified Rhizobium TaxID=2613769 RepID=UPI001AD95E88|nr:MULTISPECIES: hypothetical protein [unclassified Rhizobium]MBO9127950.1 hypothetical protein [Rhizobium sp. 16-488-2b]MBO9178527.1 hypothetical protein [Rhizobium sp. 16-488-2a]
MSVAGKSVYRVERIAGYDVAVVVEVKDEGSPSSTEKIKETKSDRICLGGLDSFWAVSGETTEKAIVHRAPTVPYTSSSTSSLIGRAKIADFSLTDASRPKNAGKLDAVSFANAVKLTVGFSLRKIGYEKGLALLAENKLAVPLRAAVQAIEVGAGKWLSSGFTRSSEGFYGFSEKISVRNAPVRSVEGKIDSLTQLSGVVVFLSQPKWSPPVEADLRSEAQILASALKWAERLRSSTEAAGDVAQLLNTRITSTADDAEREDLRSALAVLASRTEINDLVPSFMAKDPEWRDRLASFEESERERQRSAIRAQIDREMTEENRKLTDMQARVVEAEARVAAIGQRELLLRDAASKTQEELEAKIAAAANSISAKHSEIGGLLRADVEELRKAVHTITDAAPTAYVQHPPIVDEANFGSGPLEIAAPEKRFEIIRQLAATSGFSVPALTAVLLQSSTTPIPIFVGDRAITAVADFVTAIGGALAAVVYCDPTRVTLSDMIDDKASGLSAAIELAQQHPHVTIPVAFCGITNGPCEYWLPSLIERRRLGRLPANLAFFGSAAVDGTRVSVPNSVLKYIFPLEIPSGGRGNPPSFVGHWPFAEMDSDLLAEMVDHLGDLDLPDDGFVAATAKMLSRVPSSWGVRIDAVLKTFLARVVWTEALGKGAGHELIHYFQNIEG